MPCAYVIDKERRLVVSTAWDRVTFAQAKDHLTQLRNDPDFNPDYNHLIDTTAITALDISLDEIKEMAMGGIFSPASRGAFVATNTAICGLARLWEAHHSMAKVGDQVCIFSDLPSALKWLGLPETLISN